MTREEQLKLLARATVPQLWALRRIAQRFAEEPQMPEAGRESARQKMADIDAEIARRPTQSG